MDEIEESKMFLAQQKYREAATILDRLLRSETNNDEIWYLRGVTFLKMKNYDGAQECFEHALMLDHKSRYYQIKGMAHFELFEIDDALDAFKKALLSEPNDATTNFFLALCYLFLDDPRSDDHIKKAYQINNKKTSQLLLNFYTLFLKDDSRISVAQKNKIEQRMRSLKG